MDSLENDSRLLLCLCFSIAELSVSCIKLIMQSGLCNKEIKVGIKNSVDERRNLRISGF